MYKKYNSAILRILQSISSRWQTFFRVFQTQIFWKRIIRIELFEREFLSTNFTD